MVYVLGFKDFKDFKDSKGSKGTKGTKVFSSLTTICKLSVKTSRAHLQKLGGWYKNIIFA